MEHRDFEPLGAPLAARQVQVARDHGRPQPIAGRASAASGLQTAVRRSGWPRRARLLDEERLIARKRPATPLVGGYAALMLAAWQGPGATRPPPMIEATLREATGRGAGQAGRLLAAYASAVLDNGPGPVRRPRRDAAWEVFQRDHLGLSPLAVAELAEAAARDW